MRIPPIQAEAELLLTKIDDATSAANKWNNWPDRLEIVSLWKPRATLPDQYHLGELKGMCHVMRQIGRENLPDPVVGALVETGWPQDQFYWLMTVHFRWKRGSRGNNIQVVFPPENLHHKGILDKYFWPGLVVEIGCQHQMVVVSRANCYHKSLCSLCGYVEEVDSSG